jgi:hypothetical protein
MCTWQVLPPLEFAPGGRLQLVETKEDAVLRGANFFGWNVGAYNFDGLWVSSSSTSSSNREGTYQQLPHQHHPHHHHH